jgi:hypothetical protein
MTRPTGSVPKIVIYQSRKHISYHLHLFDLRLVLLMEFCLELKLEDIKVRFHRHLTSKRFKVLYPIFQLFPQLKYVGVICFA